jgi:hypothetical protein
VQVERFGSFAGDVKLTTADYQKPPGMPDIPLTVIPKDQNQATIAVKTENLPEGQFSFIISGEAQVPYEATPGNKQDVRCIYPSNPIRITVQPKQ